jgi:hypothetical protein
MIKKMIIKSNMKIIFVLLRVQQLQDSTFGMPYTRRVWYYAGLYPYRRVMGTYEAAGRSVCLPDT